MSFEQSITQTARQLGLARHLLRQGLADLIREGGALVDQSTGRVALARTARGEAQLAADLKRLMAAEVEALDVPADVWGDFAPHEGQVAAVELVASSPVSVITGGPGVGKTTVMKTVLRLLRRAGLVIVQMAPTGKAAIRLAEQTGMDAGTIHRTLKGDGNGKWQFDADTPLPADVVVVDEASMLDVGLAAGVAAATRAGARLVLVGDVDQLPSIQAGRILYDVIASGIVPVARLTKIFRQAEESRIPWLAKDINEGRDIDLRPLQQDGSDARFVSVIVRDADNREVESEDPQVITQLVVDCVMKSFPRRGFHSSQVQVLAAQKTTDCGVEALNNALQAAVNPRDDQELAVKIGGGYTVTEGDRVIHTKNNYALGVMNGEQGKVLMTCPKGTTMAQLDPDIVCSATGVQVDDAEGDDDDDTDKAQAAKARAAHLPSLVVDYGDRKVAYAREEANELLLAYAITVHKSQGSQFPAVLMLVPTAHRRMLTRQLVYTGLTRASEIAVLVGHPSALASATKNTRGAERRTQLQDFLSGEISSELIRDDDDND